MLASKCSRRHFQIEILEAIQGLTYQQKVLPEAIRSVRLGLY